MRRLLLFSLIPAAVQAQPLRPAETRPVVVSRSSITVSGPAAGGTHTIALPFMNNFENKGDWYVTATDAHAAFFLADAQASKEGRIDLELNGKQTTFVINHDNNKNTGHKTDLWFGVMVGSAQKSTLFTLDTDDEVKISITRMDSLTLEAAVSGTVTQAGLQERNGHAGYRIEVNGVISLHRATAPAERSAGNYIDCDPIIHDWLNQAQDRAPSDCEAKFDQHVRATMVKAFEPAISAFEAQQWRATKNPTAGTLTGVVRGSEKGPYQFGFAGANLGFQMLMDSKTPEYQRLKFAADVPDPGLAKVMELMKQGKYAEAQAAAKERKPTNASGEFHDNTQFDVSASVNHSGVSVLNFHGAFAASPLPGGGIVLYLPQAQPGGGGSEGDPMTYVLLGPWGQPIASKVDAEATQVSIKAVLNPSAPRLSVQTVVVSFRCSRELAQKAIPTIDWSGLRTLIAGY